MTKRDCPQLPLLVHRKTTTLASTTFSEPRRGATLLDTAETCNHTEPGHRILPALTYALRVPELLGMSL